MLALLQRRQCIVHLGDQRLHIRNGTETYLLHLGRHSAIHLAILDGVLARRHRLRTRTRRPLLWAASVCGERNEWENPVSYVRRLETQRCCALRPRTFPPLTPAPAPRGGSSPSGDLSCFGCVAEIESWGVDPRNGKKSRHNGPSATAYGYQLFLSTLHAHSFKNLIETAICVHLRSRSFSKLSD